jgi:hypothetical protein
MEQWHRKSRSQGGDARLDLAPARNARLEVDLARDEANVICPPSNAQLDTGACISIYRRYTAIMLPRPLP